MTLTDTEKISCLRLIMSENIGPATFNDLVRYYGSAHVAIEHIDELARRGGRKKPIILASVKAAERQIHLACQNDTHLIFKNEKQYPVLLRQTPDAPPVLFARGNLAVLEKIAVSIVGTRNASGNGKALARKFATDLAKADYNIVSGMAHGIDRAAHVGALSVADKYPTTTAVLGTPIDEIYPKENQDIYEQIAENGCLLSEFPFESPLSPRNFPRRNRIIAGLSAGTLVIEAQEKSGSLITANEALSYGREVMAVPGSPVDPRSAGPNALIRDGATLVSQAEDIINALGALTTFALRDHKETQTYQPVPFDENILNDARSLLMSNLGPDVIGVDDLIRETGLDARMVNIILVELAIAGRLERHPGNRVSLMYNME